MYNSIVLHCVYPEKAYLVPKVKTALKQ